MNTTLLIIPEAPLWRRILAIIYDAIMVFCVVFLAWQPVPFLPLEQLPALLDKGIRLAYMFLVTFGFFGWFWTHGGQTIGMRAWNIRLVDRQSLEQATSTPTAALRSPTWKQALLHYLVALLSWLVVGLGFVASLIHPQQKTWHDRASSTAMVIQKKR